MKNGTTKRCRNLAMINEIESGLTDTGIGTLTQ
jgi:hypothetical protein